jgi:hypothetical protein
MRVKNKVKHMGDRCLNTGIPHQSEHGTKGVLILA